MGKDSYIENTCHIVDNKVIVNDRVIYENKTATTPTQLFKEIYRHYDIKYPKFFKMDNLCKLALLVTEILIDHCETIDTKTAVVLSNKAASLDTDRNHQETISDLGNYYPSPANFVYTLPNIAIGEISIKHKLQSENAFFVFNAFNSKFLTNYATTLLARANTSAVICGWTEMDGPSYNGFVYLVRKNDGKASKDKNIDQLFKKSS